ncbi:hypothetical protein SAMN04487983_102633 [Streptomyces sp. yr375]|uniref:hypothetical protein n=1 Tax=Streptomyces sp. yr375 TaxID=1761906 RepID=UPI0008BE04FF|nr:hypothetical protein [Streptomyces sp. yr375]SER96299.1 hypothetical protein SAMN04487983_102633 [Streptomyces sp. yr375]
MPALAASALLLAAGCSSAPPQAEPPASPSARPTDADTSAPSADRALTVDAAPADIATAAAHPGSSDDEAHRTELDVASYDAKTRRAVISTSATSSTPSTPSNDDPGTPSSAPPNSPSPTSPEASEPAEASASPTSPAASSPSASATPHRTAVGDVIASAPAPGAPDGLLAEVTKVIGETAKGTEVQTKPAQLNALLRNNTAKGTVPVDPAAFDIDTLLPDVDVSWKRTGDVHVGPKGATVPLGSLRLDVRAALPTVGNASASAAASVSGFVQVAPQVDFRYGGEGAKAAPASAYLGVSGKWSSDWSLKGRVKGSATPVRIPFATLHADPVLQVGPVPVVVNLDLTCYVQISGDGKITVDVEQSLKGDFKAGGTFGLAQGWTPVSSSNMKGTGVRTSVTTAGSVQAALGTQATVGLYGSAGIVADLAPYVRSKGDATVIGNDSVFKTKGSWAVYGGVDLSGTLRLQLTIFGTPLFQRNIPLGSLHREWKLAGTGKP